MSNKLKFIFLGLILSNVLTMASPPIHVDGKDMGLEIPEEMNVPVDWSNTNVEKNGEQVNTELARVENGGELINYGSLTGSDYKTKSSSVIIGVLHSLNNGLLKEDKLISLENATFINKKGANVEMGSLEHEITQTGVAIADAFGKTDFAKYTKTVISANNSTIKNEGVITNKGDFFSSGEYVYIALLKGKMKSNYTKNLVSLTGGSLENSGVIETQGDINPQFKTGVKTGILSGELNYTRNIYGVNSNSSRIVNRGKINIAGDIYKEKTGMNGIEIDALDADLKGINNKYGIKAINNGEIENTGSIIVEKDFTKKIGVDGEILDLIILGSGGENSSNVIGLGVLSFSNMKEKSIGVSLDSSTLHNEDGKIKVSVNKNGEEGEEETINSGTKAVAVEGKNYSTVNFNGGQISLGGTNVFVSDLSNNTIMTFTGATEVNYLNHSTDKYRVNNAIFSNDETSQHIIKGELKINGDLTVAKGNNISLGVIENTEKSDEKKFGCLITEGHLNLKENIVIDTNNFLGLSQDELGQFANQTVISAGDGISGNGKLVSNSYLFNVSAKTESDNNSKTKDINNKEEIKLDTIERKDFSKIVDNKDLGKMLENSYETLTAEQRKIYEQLAAAENEQEFISQLDEITGRKNVNTLSAQVYDITKDLTGNYINLIKENSENGISFKYLNGDSKFSNTDIAEGFERESHGIIVNYNKNINEKLRTGTGFGYLKSNIDYSPSNSNNKIETWNMRGYADYNFGKLNLLSDLSFGYNDIDNKRISGKILNQGKADIYSFELNNSIYTKFLLNDKFILSPSLNLNFAYLMQKDYDENTGTKFKSSNNFMARGGANILGEYEIFSLLSHKMYIKANLEYFHEFNTEFEDVEGKIYGFNDWIKYKSRAVDRDSLIYEVGLNYKYDNRFILGVNYKKELINDVDNNQVGADFTYKF